MNAPLLWILFPGLLAVVLFVLKRWGRETTIVGTLAAFLLALLAWKLPLSEIIPLGPWSITFSPNLEVLGRQFILDGNLRPILGFIYLTAAFWLGGSYAARAGPYFTPFSLGVVTLMTAALAVRPFLYAALLIEMAALLCVPLLSSPGKRAGRGVLRFLAFQTVGTPFILITGWLITGAEAIPGDTTSIIKTLVPLGIGFGFLLAVFPFHTWIPMLAEESHPYAAAFVFFMLPGIVSLFGLGFLESYAWLRNSQMVFTMLLLAGTLMVITGGLWAAFQRHLGRMMGYAVLVDLGLSLLAIGIHRGVNLGATGFSPSLVIFFALFVSRGLCLGVWALSLSAIREKSDSVWFKEVQGSGRKLPIAAAGLILAHFSLSGFPLLVGFPVRLALWEELGRISPIITFWVLVGSLGLLAGGFRTLAVLVMGEEAEDWQVNEKGPILVLLVVGIAALFLVGLYPLV